MGISDDIAQAESSGRANVPAKTSSALGLGQFLKATWLEMMRRYHPELAQGRSDAEILELRKNPFYSQEMTRKYAEENEAKLRQAGIPVTPGSTYLMHFAGPSGGIALMKADPNTPVESILSDQAIKANPFLQGKTASSVIAWANKKMADAAKSSVAPQPAPWHTQQSIPYLAQTQATEPAFGATSWPPRPASPNVLPPDTARPSVAAPGVAPAPFMDGARTVQQALDNSLPAPGATPWDFSNRFGAWDSMGGASAPAAASGSGVFGQTGDGRGAGGGRFAQTSGTASDPPQPAALSSNIDPVSIRRLTSPLLGIVPVDPNQPLRNAGPTPGITGSMPSFPPVWSPPAALLAPARSRALGDWVKPLPFNQAALPAQDAPGGIPGLLMQLGAFDPSHPDDPPAAGLLRLLHDYMRNNPKDNSAS